MTATSPSGGLDAAETAALGPHATAFADRLARLVSGLSVLPDKPEETPASALRALWHLAAGRALSAHAALEQPLSLLDAAQAARLDELIARRLSGAPLAYLTGWQRFMGLELMATPAALIPRAETEMLARAALARLEEDPTVRSPVVVDVCCGSGNVGLALAHAASSARVHGSDLSEAAIALARDNAARLGLADRVEFRVGDLMAPFGAEFDRQVDLVVSAPPYISTSKMDSMAPEIVGHEPHLAFDGGPFGVRILVRLIRESPRLLRPGGWFGMEVGLGQGPAMAQLLQRDAAYDRVETVCDAGGAIRIVLARAAGG